MLETTRSVHITLVEDDASLGIQPRGEQHRERFPLPSSQLFGVLAHRDGVEIHDGVYEACVGRGGALEVVPLPESSEVVSQVGDAGGLDAGEDHLSLWGVRFGVTEALVSMLAREDRSAASTAEDGTPVHRC